MCFQCHEHDWRVATRGEPESSSIHCRGWSMTLFTEFPKAANGFTFAFEHLVIIKQEVQMGKASPDMEVQPDTREVMQYCYRRLF